MAEHELTKIKIKDLKPYDNNSKIHTDYQIDLIKKSIEEFGFVNPILNPIDLINIARNLIKCQHPSIDAYIVSNILLNRGGEASHLMCGITKCRHQ